MERFTYKHDGQWCINGARNGEHRGALTSDVRANYWGEAVDQLAAYENTKLSPEQVDEIAREINMLGFPSVSAYLKFVRETVAECQRHKKSDSCEPAYWLNVEGYGEHEHIADCSHCHQNVVLGEHEDFCPACGWPMAGWKVGD